MKIDNHNIIAEKLHTERQNMIRKATPNDTKPIKILKDTIWPSDSTTEEHIQTILNDPKQTIIINEINSEITGLTAAFATTSQDKIKRWEVDLLAVHPQYQRQGIAKNLVNAITEIGREKDTKITRALIQIENIGSQRTFAACGYTTNSDIQTLYVSDGENTSTPDSVDECYLIPVSTLNYRGVWIEDKFLPETFKLAQTMRTRHQWDIAGAVIPTTNKQAITTAEANGFTFINYFQTWIYEFK
jgi:GNAT superfamily N-acetyltransferase